jgi:hypothetical protein
MFSVSYLPKLYKGDQLPLRLNTETAVRREGTGVKLPPSLEHVFLEAEEHELLEDVIKERRENSD